MENDTLAVELNLAVICGRLVADPELKVFDSGARLIRYLITVCQDTPRRRVDVIPVTLWDPTDEQVEDLGKRSQSIWVRGSIQRRFWESPDGRRSRLEVVAEDIRLTPVESVEPVESVWE